jgi:hypothetical protein
VCLAGLVQELLLDCIGTGRLDARA